MTRGGRNEKTGDGAHLTMTFIFQNILRARNGYEVRAQNISSLIIFFPPRKNNIILFIRLNDVKLSVHSRGKEELLRKLADSTKWLSATGSKMNLSSTKKTNLEFSL